MNEDLETIRDRLLRKAWPRIANRDGISEQTARMVAVAELEEIEAFMRAVARDEMFSRPPSPQSGSSDQSSPGVDPNYKMWNEP
ncbi:hypothetical protein MicloDRAFT_00064190 [Microvirga lotononidis]|uniref:Uncharacterized protein n=1 Tax=Microvirga lotononidis TaxID=864069 RepID=I4YP00_9HYPH|nr:hypothetical protein MicloDRAFT_00064190 [Microvirga lotononidis]